MSLIGSRRNGHQGVYGQSLAQERRINRSGSFKRWQMSDATQVLLPEKVIGVMALPILAFWVFLFGFFSFGIATCLGLFQVMSRVIRRR